MDRKAGYRSEIGGKRGGYTIAEMIIVIAVITILFTIGYRTYFTERDRFAFNDSLAKVLQLIQTARSHAISSQPVFVPGKGQIVSSEGYGVKIHLSEEVGESTMTLFANVGSQVDQMDSDDVVMETFTLPMQIRFKYFYFDDIDDSPDMGLEEQWLEDEDEPENSGPTAYDGIILFRPPLAEASVFGFKKADPATSVELGKIAIRLQNPQAVEGSPKQCQIVTFSRVKVFPELTYDNCQ